MQGEEDLHCSELPGGAEVTGLGTWRTVLRRLRDLLSKRRIQLEQVSISVLKPDLSFLSILFPTHEAYCLKERRKRTTKR